MLHARYLIAFFHGDFKGDINQNNLNSKLNISNTFNDNFRELHDINITNNDMLHEDVEKHIPCVYGIYLYFFIVLIYLTV